MFELMQAHPLATLVMQTSDGLDANQLPLYLAKDERQWGTLRGHVARANPLWKEGGDAAVLAIFRGPDAYVTPSWYPSKQETGRVVPTWSYAVVHAHGRLQVHEDAVWIRQHLHDMTHQFETGFAEPWRVSDAPEDYIERLLEMVVGIEIPIQRLEGKWKVSQNQPENNRQGVIHGLRQQTGGDCPMAALMETHKTGN